MFNFKHPRDIHLGYLSHLKFAWLESIRAFTMSIVMLIHGIFPFIPVSYTHLTLPTILLV